MLWYILLAHPEDRSLLESNPSAVVPILDPEKGGKFDETPEGHAAYRRILRFWIPFLSVCLVV